MIITLVYLQVLLRLIIIVVSLLVLLRYIITYFKKVLLGIKYEISINIYYLDISFYPVGF